MRGSGRRARARGCAACAGPQCKRVHLKCDDGRSGFKASASCASAARRSRARARIGLPGLRSTNAGARRGCVRTTRAGRSGVQGHSHDPAQTSLPMLQHHHPAADAWPADRAKHRSSEPAGGHPRLEVRRPPAVVPAIGDRGARRRDA